MKLRLQLRQHLANRLLVGARYHRSRAQAALALGVLLGQDVAVECVLALDAPASGGAEPFGGTAVRFHLGHVVLLLVMPVPQRLDGLLAEKALVLVAFWTIVSKAALRLRSGLFCQAP